MSTLILRWYAYVMMLLFSVGISYGGIFPAMISSDSWGWVSAGFILAAATLVPVGYGVNLIWELSNEIINKFKEKK